MTTKEPAPAGAGLLERISEALQGLPPTPWTRGGKGKLAVYSLLMSERVRKGVREITSAPGGGEVVNFDDVMWPKRAKAALARFFAAAPALLFDAQVEIAKLRLDLDLARDGLLGSRKAALGEAVRVLRCEWTDEALVGLSDCIDRLERLRDATPGRDLVNDVALGVARERQAREDYDTAVDQHDPNVGLCDDPKVQAASAVVDTAVAATDAAVAALRGVR